MIRPVTQRKPVRRINITPNNYSTSLFCDDNTKISNVTPRSSAARENKRDFFGARKKFI